MTEEKRYCIHTNIVWGIARCAEALTFNLFSKSKVGEFEFGSNSTISIEKVLWLYTQQGEVIVQSG